MATGFTINADTKDDHDFYCMDYSSKRARMSCGHTVTAESLTAWCEKQLEEHEGKFHCGVCPAEWSFEEVSKLVTEKQRTVFDKKVFKNTFTQNQVKCCPGCKFYVKRRDSNNLSVYCPQCTTQKGKSYEFCWQCLKEWKGPRPRSDKCENDGCTNEALNVLRTCKNIDFKQVKGVKGCPSVRACPTCGHVIEHSGEKCKNMTCPDCKVEFCFVCLKLTKECSYKTKQYYGPCKVADRQESLPIRK